MIAFDLADRDGAASRIAQGPLGIGKPGMLPAGLVHENARERDELAALDDW
ncbi:MAG TPA: hypothetical protein VF523_02760 [Burkholderiales bacterium]